MKRSHSSRTAVLIALMLIMSSGLSAQEKIAELEIGSRYHNPEWSGMVIGDSLFLAYKQYDPNMKETRRMIWVGGNGSVREIDLSELGENPVIGVVTDGKRASYYFVEEDRKLFYLKSLAYDETTGTKRIALDGYELPGKLIGSYIDKDLNLLCARPDEDSIVLVTFHNAVPTVKRFSFPTTLLKSARTRISFIDLSGNVSIPQADATKKLFKDGHMLYLCTDIPPVNSATPPSPAKTTVASLNMETGAQGEKIFPARAVAPVGSFIYQGRLYRTTQERDLRLEVIDLETRETLHTQFFPVRKKKDTPYRLIQRSGEYKSTVNAVSRRMHDVKYPVVTGGPGGEVVVLTKVFTGKTFLPILFGWGQLVQAFSLAARLIVSQIDTGPETYAYCYLQGAPGGEYTFVDDPGLVQNRVDAHEISQSDPHQFRGYLDGLDISFGFYRKEKSTLLEVVKFKR